MPLAVTAILIVTLAGGFSKSLPPEAREAFDRANRRAVAMDWPAARPDLERIIAMAPNYAPAYELYAQSLGSTAYAAAQAAAIKRTEAEPDNAVAWYALGQIERDRRYKRAAFERVVALAPGEPWGHYGLALVAFDESRYAEAFALYEKALALAPDEPSINSSLVSATTYYVVQHSEGEELPDRAERVERARRAWASIRRAAPNGYAALQGAGMLSDLVSGPELLDLARYFVATFPEAASVGWAYNQLLIEAEQKDPKSVPAKARDAISRMAPIRAPFAAYWRRRIFGEYLLGPAVKANSTAPLATEVLAWRDADPMILLALGNALAAKDPALARRCFEHGLAADEPNADRQTSVADGLRLGLGRLYLDAGEAARAITVLETVEDKEYAQRATALLARAFAATGATAKAFDAYVRAVATDPSPELVAGLGAAAKALGRTEADATAAVWAARDAAAKPAPEVSLPDLEGRDTSLAAHRGKVVLLNFWFPT